MRITLWVSALLCAAATPAWADVTLAGVFGDNMVLQRDVPLTIWGTADPGEAIRVNFDSQDFEGTADADGRFGIQVGPFPVQAARELTVKGKNTIVLKGVCIGDVWVCSGQSNMSWRVKQSMNAKAEIAEALNPRLRVFTMHSRISGEPQQDFDKRQGGWSLCNPSTVGNFSAVAYYFAREVRKDLAIPVGIIVTAWGGTPAESWTRREALLANDDCKPIVQRWDKLVADHPAALQKHQLEMALWKKQADQARKTRNRAPRRPAKPLGPQHPHRASGLWNGMIQPLTPLRIAGFLWYQGESNAGRAEQYATLFPAMIQDWRAAWQQGDVPFFFVQLANFRPVRPEPVQSAWAELRDAQRRTLSLPATAMAVAIDIGEAKDIHPKNKQEVGRRLALAARALVYPDEVEGKYGKDIVYSGPLYDQLAVAGGKALVSFLHVGRGLRTRNADPLVGFTIAGADKVFHVAHARIEGNHVEVWHPKVTDPVAVRYGWADNPVCNLINDEQLPASPFRTDDWPGITAGKR